MNAPVFARTLRHAATLPPRAARALVTLLTTAIAAADVSGADIFAAKISIPAELRTAEWARIPTWIRERAFFMAAVDQAQLLDGFRTTAEKFTAGTLSLAEAREQIRALLVKHDYAPLPGQAGTIKDLSTLRRQHVALETNLLQVNGHARWARQQAALGGFPAQRLVRVSRRNVPRDWPARWRDAIARTTAAGATSGEGEGEGVEMVALVNHPLWILLSRFRTPYPPFDFNSGKGIEPVPRDEAENLGLLHAEDAEGAEEIRRMLEPQNRGLNETLEASPEIRSQVVRNGIAKELQGFARWEDDRLVFTDPNGTRPMDGAALEQLLAADFPEDFPALQRDAIEAWAEDPDYFREGGDRDMWEDLLRAKQRIVSGARPEGESLLAEGIRALAEITLEQLDTFGRKGAA